VIFVFALAGILTGTITGMIPGLHSNNIAIILAPLSLFGKEAMVFVIAMIITQSFVDFIPAIFFGAPNTDTFEGVLPGHKLLLDGLGFEAICLTVLGGIIAIIAGTLVLPIFIEFLKINKERFFFIIPLVLIFTILILVLNEKNNKKKTLILFVLLSSAGQSYLFPNQIFPLITGYFGIPTILYSIQNSPRKIIQKAKVKLKLEYIKDSLTGLLGGAIVSIIPGIGSNVAAAIIQTFKTKIQSKNYLVLIGSINTSNLFFSFPVLLFLNKARNGGMILLKEKIFFTESTLLTGIIIILISAGAGGAITIFLAKKISSLHFNSKKAGICIIIFLILLVGLFNGIPGLITLFFASALGLFVVLKKIKRSACLGSLIIPVLFYYVFVFIL
jgi:putative membrane protein